MFAWAQNRHIITGWYGVGSAIKSFLEVRGDEGLKLLRRMFEDSRLFRLIIDEVEKTLLLVDLDIARDYASLVADEGVRDNILGLIEDELARTKEMALNVSGGSTSPSASPNTARPSPPGCPPSTRSIASRSSCLRRFRGAERETEREAFKSALLLSINTVAAGLGATG